jgi:YggT family protein
MNTTSILITFLNSVNLILWVSILARVLMSWFAVDSAAGPVVRLLDDITEPILGRLRRIIPPIGMIDITPIVAIILIQAIFGLIIHQIH